MIPGYLLSVSVVSVIYSQVPRDLHHNFAVHLVAGFDFLHERQFEEFAPGDFSLDGSVTCANHRAYAVGGGRGRSPG